MSAEQSPWLTRHEAAEILKVHVMTIDRMIQRGTLKARKFKHGKTTRIPRSEVMP